MASIEDYQNFGGTLVDYVNASGGAAGLQAAFQEGGVLHGALKSLDTQEAGLNTYQANLLEAFEPGQVGSLTQEQVNDQVAKNDVARNEIQSQCDPKSHDHFLFWSWFFL